MTSLQGAWRWLHAPEGQVTLGDKNYYLRSVPFFDFNGVELFKLRIAMDQKPFRAMTIDLVVSSLPVYLGLLAVACFVAYFMKRNVFNTVGLLVKALQRLGKVICRHVYNCLLTMHKAIGMKWYACQ